MALNINRYISYLRNKGENWVALALGEIQDAINSPQPASITAQSSPAAVAASASQTPSGTSSQTVLGVQNGLITAASIAPGAVSSTALAPGAVGSASLGPGSVSTNNIALSAVSAIASDLQLSVALGTSLALIATVTVDTDGGNVIVFAGAQLNNTGASQEVIRVQVYKGTNAGTLLLDTGASGLPVGASLALPWSVAGLLDSSPASSQEYTVYASIAAGTGTATNLLLTAVNLKR